MHDSVEKLAYKIAEGVLSSSTNRARKNVNIYHRKVTAHRSTNISFINGLVTSGIRGIANIDATLLTENFTALQAAARQHLPLVVNVDAMDNGISAFNQGFCFILIAGSPQEHVYFSLLAQRITELSLVPGIIVAAYANTNEEVALPADELLKIYLGNPDDQIECPTPAQRMIFGSKRRRIPKWFSLDIPVMFGAEKGSDAKVSEIIASEKYFFDHLHEIIPQAISEFNVVFGIEIKIAETIGKINDTVIVTNSPFATQVYVNSDVRKLPQLLNIKQLCPVPMGIVKKTLEKKNIIAVIEDATFGGANSYFYNKIERLAPKSSLLYSVRINQRFSDNILEDVSNHIANKLEPYEIFGGLAFTKEGSQYPKHEILLQEIDENYPELKSLTIGKVESNKTPRTIKPASIPLSVRRHSDKGPNYSKLARFYDDTAYFYQQEAENELVADPFAALPITPSESAGFFNNELNDKFPVFRASKCTACGDCFVHCPHAALPPLVIGIEQLLNTGINLASAKGNLITKLTPMLKNLAKLSGKAIGENKITTLTDFLPSAFNDLTGQMNLEGENLEQGQREFNLVLEELKEIPIAITEEFYSTPNTAEKGSGEIFSLVVNPSSCTACGICEEVCDENAIVMEGVEDNTIIKAQQLYSLWEELPEVSASTLARLTEDGEYNKLAQLLLPRANYQTMNGASISESDNHYKSMLHIITATANSIIQPRLDQQLENIDKLITSISESVHTILSKALPKENLEALSRILQETRSGKTTFQEIVDKINEQEEGKVIDTKALKRKTELVDALKNLKWVLEDGPTGLGRSSYGLNIAGNKTMAWARAYPTNIFREPVLILGHINSPELILGQVQGHIRHIVDNIKLIRRAELEAVNKYDPMAHDLEIATLDWAKLTVDERRTVPPLLLITEREDLDANGWQGLQQILAVELPIKVIVFDHISPAGNNALAQHIQSSAGIISAIALKKAFVFQGSIANENHLASGLLEGISLSHSALFNIYTYKAGHHDATENDWLPYAKLAAASRTFPAISFTPDKEHGFLNGTIKLEENENYLNDWVEEEIQISSKETMNYKISWADWAYSQPEWQSEFKKVSRDDSNVLVADYVKLSSKDRTNKIPIIIRNSQNGLIHYSVSRIIVDLTETVLANWNTLQELAGLITEFPVRLSDEVKKELTKKFEEDASELKKEYENMLIEKELEYAARLRTQIKEKLIALASMARN